MMQLIFTVVYSVHFFKHQSTLLTHAWLLRAQRQNFKKERVAYCLDTLRLGDEVEI